MKTSLNDKDKLSSSRKIYLIISPKSFSTCGLIKGFHADSVSKDPLKKKQKYIILLILQSAPVGMNMTYLFPGINKWVNIMCQFALDLSSVVKVGLRRQFGLFKTFETLFNGVFFYCRVDRISKLDAGLFPDCADREGVDNYSWVLFGGKKGTKK